MDRSRLSQIELGKGGGVPADLWFALADALGMPFRMEFGRDPTQELEDAGHLDMQEFTLRLGRAGGFDRGFELATRPSNPAYSVDVGLRDDVRRLLVLEECWNTFGNIGASVRSTRRKIAEAEALGVAAGGDRGSYQVAAVWIVRDAPRNRARGAPVPAGLGLVWCDPGRGRLTAWRRRQGISPR